MKTTDIEVRRDASFTLLFDAVLDDERLGKNEILVYLALCRFANGKTRECFPSFATIAKAARLATSTTQAAIKNLEKYGILDITTRNRADGGKSSNLYRLSEGVLPPTGKGALPPTGKEEYSYSEEDTEKRGKGSPKAPRERRERVARRKTPPKVSKPETTELGATIDSEAKAQRGAAPSWTREDRESVAEMAAKHGGEAVLRAWRAYLQRGKSVSIRFFLQDTQIGDYARGEPKPAPVCGDCGSVLLEWELSNGCTKCAAAETAKNPNLFADLPAYLRGNGAMLTGNEPQNAGTETDRREQINVRP